MAECDAPLCKASSYIFLALYTALGVFCCNTMAKLGKAGSLNGTPNIIFHTFVLDTILSKPLCYS